MKTANQLAALEVLAFETGLRHEELQTEFNRRQLLPTSITSQQHAQRFVNYLRWLYNELEEVYDNPNRSATLPVIELPVFNVWAANILGMTVHEYLNAN